jgi:hypothetical protein
MPARDRKPHRAVYKGEAKGMDAVEKARIRLEHWISHNDHHEEEYTEFARQLEREGKGESAGYIREMIPLSARSNECLKKALKALT